MGQSAAVAPAVGDPVPVERLATVAGLPLEQVESRLRAEPGVDWDDQGRILGFGLTQRPTRHRFIVGGRTLYAFCGPDTLNLPAILGQSAVVESTCAATGAPIRIEGTPDAVTSVDPPTTVVTQVHFPADVTDVRANACDHSPFYASYDATADWRRDHPDGTVLPVAEYVRQTRAIQPKLP